MNAEQMRLFRCGYGRMAAIAESAAAMIHARLVESDPASRQLFQGDIRVQGAMLMQTLDMAVRHRHQPGRVRAALHAQTRHHDCVTAQQIHYHAVSQALVWIVRQGMATDMAADVRQSWEQAGKLLLDLFEEPQVHFDRAA